MSFSGLILAGLGMIAIGGLLVFILTSRSSDDD
jgi:hypothetical protein